MTDTCTSYGYGDRPTFGLCSDPRDPEHDEGDGFIEAVENISALIDIALSAPETREGRERAFSALQFAMQALDEMGVYLPFRAP